MVAGSNYTVVLTQWHTYMYFLAISFFAIHLRLSISGQVERRSLYVSTHVFKDVGPLTYDVVFWSVTAWIATSAVILATAPKTDAEFVFTTFTNETGWPDGVAWMLGLLQSAVSCSQPVEIRSHY